MFRWLKKNKQTPQTEPDEPHVRAEIEEEVDPALAAEIEKRTRCTHSEFCRSGP